MANYNWCYFDNDDIKDEITLAKLTIEEVKNDTFKSEKDKSILIDLILEKLKSLYDEQRKRKSNP